MSSLLFPAEFPPITSHLCKPPSPSVEPSRNGHGRGLPNPTNLGGEPARAPHEVLEFSLRVPRRLPVISPFVEQPKLTFRLLARPL